ncbi:MAG: hypothetical protein KY455_00840 [Euryarchaeota archaeon]|nr:hypothetical protein [Euryarchaeota archaeon]
MGTRSLATLVLATTLLAGCLGGGPQSANDDPDGTEALTSTGTPTSGADVSGTDKETTGDDPDEGDGGTSSDDQGSDTGNDTREPSPPQEQEKSNPDELERPGDYALLPYRKDRDTTVRLDVPEWKTGDRWTWTWDVLAPCQAGPGGSEVPYEYSDKVGLMRWEHGVAAYDVERTVTCGEETASQHDLTFLEEHLVPIEDDGYVARLLLFPLEDGKRWIWMNGDGHNHTSEISYLPQYIWNGKVVTAWKVVSEHESGRFVQERVFSDHADNLLATQDRFDGAPVAEGRLKSFQRAS